ncbi:hypothetical protein SY88_09795 [Clostridiales bacterium PH28_bin88]|nr:hypothetical protein SY88_09795 [Clostridiales bacterium PH28_bin88]
MRRKTFAFIALMLALLVTVTGCRGSSKPTLEGESKKDAAIEKEAYRSGPSNQPEANNPEPQREPAAVDPYKQDLAEGVSSAPKVNMGAYPSPGRRATIVLKAQHDIGDGTLNADFYLVGSKGENLIHQANLGWDWNDPVAWVDDNRVLLHNTWLYNLSNREGKDIRPADADYIWAAALNNDRTLLAITGKTSSSPMRIAVWIVNLATGELTNVVNYPPNPGWTEGPDFHVSWDPKGNLYFDADHKGQPAIFRYSSGQKEPEVFLEKAWAPAISPDGQYLAYLAGKGYYYHESFHTKIRELKSGTEMDIGNEGGRKYWSPDGRYLALFQGNTVKYFQVAKYEGENTTLVRQFAMEHPCLLRFMEFVDYSHMLIQESNITSEGLIEEAKYHVFGPDPASGKVWEAAREYMEAKGYTVGLREKDMVLAVGRIFDNRVVVAYGPKDSEFYAELLLENEADGNWRVVTDQHMYAYYDDSAEEAIKALASQEGYDFGWEPGKMRVGVKLQDNGRYTLVVGKYGWPWSREYDLEKVDGNWEIISRRDIDSNL